jgi:hypothetical protein
MTTKNINAIVGKSDENLSGALDSLPDLHVHFARNTDDEYLLISDNNKKKMKKSLRYKSNSTHEFDRQISTMHRKIDQFQVKYFYLIF